MVDSRGEETYSSVVTKLSVRILMVLYEQNRLSLMTGDVSNAFLNAPETEKVYPRAGKEFGERCGSTLIIKKAVYVMKSDAI